MILSTLKKSVREFKKLTIITPIIVIFEVLFNMAIPLLMGQMIDNGVQKGDMGVVIRYGIILLILILLGLAAGIAAGLTAARASSGYARNLRRDIYFKVQDYAFANIDKFSTSSLVTRMTTDVTNVQNSYQILLRMAIRSPIMLIFSLIMSFAINPSVSLIFLIVIPILGGGMYLIMTRAHPVFQRVFKKYDRLNLVVQEDLRGIRVVKSFVREDKEKEKFDVVSEDIYKDFTKGEKLIAFSGPLMMFSIYLVILLISWFSAKHIVSGNMTTGNLVSLIAYASQILMGLMFFSIVLLMFTISKPSAERITEVLNEESTIKNPARPIMTVADGSVAFKNVFFSYSQNSERPVLDNINLEIAAGETVGIIGGTGASKSSLVQLIPRLYDVTGGSLEVGGIDVRDYDMDTLRNQVAMVLQKNVLFSGTIKENLRWGNKNATDEEIVEACLLAQADGFIRAFPNGYDTYIEQGGSNVSGGQKQRLCIARALLKNPKILILDDSTSAVDTRTEAQIRKAFQEKLPDTTKIIIAQRATSVMDADKIIIMDDGKINAVGTHAELLKSNLIYQEVYTSQNRKEGDLHE